MDRLSAFKNAGDARGRYPQDSGPQMRETLNAEISVFLALVFVLVASLVLTSVEMLRTQAASAYLRIAADSAIDSLFSQYHLDLWNRYRLLGLEMYAPAEITDEYYGFLEPYLDTADNWNWYGLTTAKDDIGISEYRLLTDDNGAVFEQEVRDYMLFGIALDAVSLTSLTGSQAALDSAMSTSEISGEMKKCSEKANKLEKRLRTLSLSVAEHNQLILQMRRALAEGNGHNVRTCLQRLRSSLSDIKNDAGAVDDSTVKLKGDVKETRAGLREKLAGGTITLQDYNQLEYQFGGFDSYTQVRGEKNRELVQLLRDVERNIEKLDQLESEADEAQEYINSWVPEQILVRYDPPAEKGGKPVPVYEDEVLDEAAVWSSAAECFTSYEELAYSTGSGVVNEVLSDQFDQISGLLEGNLIELVFPDGAKVSREERDLTDAPSKIHFTSDTNIFNSDHYLLNKAAVDEYAVLELSNVLSKKDDVSPAEVEYVLWGNKTDIQNVSAVAGELIAVRTGLNLTYMFTDPAKLKDAGALAIQITGGGSGTPVVLVITFLILTVWATAQAVIDTRHLFEGGKVPFMHTKETFTLTLEGLLTDFKGELTKKSETDTGMQYKEYLRLFLFSRSGSRTDYRIMDVIQTNLRKEQSDFRIDRLYTSLDMTVGSRSEHVFSDLLGEGPGEYTTAVSTYYGYS